MSNITLSAEELIRYSQQIKLDQIGLKGQEKLKKARVLCVGLGGLGSPLLLYLAGAGVGTLGIVDDDEVDLSNLQRQILYCSADVSKSKALMAKQRLLELNPTIQINAYPEKLTQENAAKLISQYDIIADGSDNFYTRYLIHDLCFELDKPYVYASATQFQGYASVFQGSKGACLRCLFPTPPPADEIPNCEEGGVLGVLPGILGLIQANEIIKWITQIGISLENRLLMVDLLNIRFREITLSKNSDCKLCVHHQAPELLIEMQCNGSAIDLKSYAISEKELEELLIKNPEAVLIDVRTEKEHLEKNRGGRLMPLAELKDHLPELDQQELTILYCQSGKRSALAAKILVEEGFDSVKYLSD